VDYIRKKTQRGLTAAADERLNQIPDFRPAMEEVFVKYEECQDRLKIPQNNRLKIPQ